MGNAFHHTTVASLLITDDDTSVAAEVNITEHHIHNYERWMGAQATQVGPGSQSRLTGFRLTSDATANVFGAAVTIFTGIETPTQTGKKYFDFHRIQILDSQNNNKIYRIRFANNSQGQANWTDAVAAGVYSDLCFNLSINTLHNKPITMLSKRLPAGTIIWAAVATADAVSQWVDFLIGIHEYDN